MKIREGFVTNSSSTNFLLITKRKISVEYLMKKLGIKKGSPLGYIGRQLCEEIIRGTTRGLRWFDFDEINYANIEKAFCSASAEKYVSLVKKNYFVFWGHTDSDSGYLTSYFTTDSFIIDDPDFYIDGKNCMW